MAFFSNQDNIFSSERSKRLGKEQLQYLVKELARDLKQGETLLQSLPIGIIVLNRAFHLQLMNRAARRCPLFAPHQKASMNNKKRPIWQGLSHEKLAMWLQGQLQGEGAPSPREFDYFNVNHEPCIMRIEISSQVRNGAIEGWIILLTDVSQLRQQERKLQQLDILASLFTVTAGVAHEIKNPLAAISLHIQLMQRLLRQAPPCEASPTAKGTLQSPLNSQLQEYCAIVHEEIERLNTFVTDFLLTVRPMELELRSENIHQIILTCVELLEPELKNKNIQLKLDLSENLPNVALDASMFHRLLLNIVQNAIQAIEEKAEQLLYTGRLQLASYQKDEKIYLEIADNGCGMSEATRKKILEPFFTTRTKGSGLGMTMVLRILQTHNGDLQIQSEKGKGTLLRIILPVFQKQQKLLVNLV